VTRIHRKHFQSGTENDRQNNYQNSLAKISGAHTQEIQKLKIKNFGVVKP
jgi:hypothetical protein